MVGQGRSAVRIAKISLLALASCSWYVDPPPPSPAPPVSGGSVMVTKNGAYVYSSDPARDSIFVIDLQEEKLVATLTLDPGDQPGRLVEDADGRVHVALRAGGALVTIVDGQIAERRGVCPEPRGLAHQPEGDLIHVACAGGELVSFPAAGGEAVRRVEIDRDLRDVVYTAGQLWVTRFRASELVAISPEGTILGRQTPPPAIRNTFNDFGEPTEDYTIPSIAWRAIPTPHDNVLVVHQRSTGGPLSVQQGGYGGGGCGEGPTESTATLFDGSEVPELSSTLTSAASRRFPFGVLPVDIAVSPTGEHLAVAMAGTRNVRVMETDSLSREVDPCGFDPGDLDLFPGNDEVGLPTGLAFTPFSSELIVQYDNAYVVYRSPTTDPSSFYQIRLPGPDRNDRGRAIFHQATFSGLACASCHPEGREDGLVWEFGELGRRRTQNLGGFILERAPYHWGGDMRDLHMLAEEVLVGRMGGNPLSEEDKVELTAWLGHLPALAPSPGSAARIERGRAIFEDSEVGCATCHSGPLYTNNAMADVGTGGLFKVPSLLGVGARAPFLHDGCAATLRDRFSDCGGGDFHGVTSHLSESQLGDLIAFLESL